MPETREAESRRLADLTLQWDRIAELRHQQIADGVDVSFNHVVVPAALSLLSEECLSLLLDVGCGTGHFSALVAPIASQVIGIDPSAASIEVAKRVCQDFSNTRFVTASLEDAAQEWKGPQATAAAGVMMLMTAPDLAGFARRLRSVLVPGGAFVAVVPHPCFWPTYWGYVNEPWYDYMKEIFIEAPFEISKAQTQVWTTHIHRPLTQYLACFSAAGFELKVMEELRPDPQIEALYPKRWPSPRFVALKWLRH
jgi:SAM-dependent methyltransferase